MISNEQVKSASGLVQKGCNHGPYVQLSKNGATGHLGIEGIEKLQKGQGPKRLTFKDRFDIFLPIKTAILLVYIDLRDMQLAYGRTWTTLELPEKNIAGVLLPKSRKPPLPAREMVLAALENPLAGRHLTAAPTLFILPDKTRSCGAHQFLSELIDYCNQIGIADSSMTILFANGSHVSNSDNEVQKILGDGVASRIQVYQHNAKDERQLEYVGTTSFGTPVYLNRLIRKYPQVVLVATAVHHYFAGFGGGAKMANPGCAGYETIRRNHALTIDVEGRGIHPQCRSGNMTGNPVQDDIHESLQFIDPPLLLETVLNDGGEIVDVFFGEIQQAHQRACSLVEEMFQCQIPHKSDLVVASCGGFPKDINLIQVHKTIHNAFQAVKPGGVVVALAQCSQGIGSETFLPWFEDDVRANIVHRLALDYKLNGTTALSLMQKCRAAEIVLVSDLPEGIVRKLSMIPMPALQSALDHALTPMPADFHTYILPNGSLTLPVGGNS